MALSSSLSIVPLLSLSISSKTRLAADKNSAENSASAAAAALVAQRSASRACDRERRAHFDRDDHDEEDDYIVPKKDEDGDRDANKNISG